MSALDVLPSFASRPRRLPARWLVAAAAGIAAVAHVPVIGPHLEEAPYMGVLFIVLTAACGFLAIAALIRDSGLVYALTVATCGLAVIGYIATRLIAFPMLSDDVGNWAEPLGVVSIASESIAVAAALLGLRRRSRSAAGRVRAPLGAAPH